MPTTPIEAPAGFVPVEAIAFSGPEGAVRVGVATPLPTSEPSYRSATALTPDVEAAPGRAIAVVAAGRGTVRLVLDDLSAIDLPIEAGLSILPFAVRRVVGAGTTAVATFANLA
jgi:hypothetical protein